MHSLPVLSRHRWKMSSQDNPGRRATIGVAVQHRRQGKQTAPALVLSRVKRLITSQVSTAILALSFARNLICFGCSLCCAVLLVITSPHFRAP